MRGARREYALAARPAAWRQHLGAPALVEVKPEQHPDVIPAVEIEQRVLEILPGQELDAAGGVAAGARSPHGFGLRCERRAHIPDRLDRQHLYSGILRSHRVTLPNPSAATADRE